MSTWDNEPDEDRAVESGTEATRPGQADLPLEANEADAIEQAIAVDAGDGAVPRHLDVPLEASEADAIDQALTVGGDEDEMAE